MRQTHVFKWMLPVVSLLVFSCADEAATGPVGDPVAWDSAELPLVTGIRDSAGVRIVENAQPPSGSRLPWRIGTEPTVSIGEATGEDAYLLHQADAALMLRDRRVVIANSGTDEIRVYDAEGVHLGTWGGPGEGPGEFGYLRGIALWPGDSVLAVHTTEGASDGGWPWRGQLFDNLGNPGRHLRSESRVGLPFEPRIVLADGGILGRRASAPGGRIEGYFRMEVAYELLGLDRPAEGFGIFPDREAFNGVANGIPLSTGMAFSRRALDTSWGDLLVIGTNDRYEIRAYRVSDGTLARIVRREHVNRAPTRPEVVDAAIRTLANMEGPRDALEAFRRAYEGMPIVESFPAFRVILSDPQAHLWVLEYELPETDRPASLWTVYDDAGHALGYVETPAGLSLLEIGADYLLGRQTDELGIERIQVWALERDDV